MIILEVSIIFFGVTVEAEVTDVCSIVVVELGGVPSFGWGYL